MTGRRSYRAPTRAALARSRRRRRSCDPGRGTNYVRPRVDTGLAFEIEAGRHPVVEAMADRCRGINAFIANDCELAGARAGLWLLTGPNMAGKSTFLRQNALIAVMAQIGSFVPAKTGRPYRRRRPIVQPGRRRRRSGARPLDLHGRDGRDRGNSESGRRARPGDPGRDRPRHGDLRWPVDRLGDHRAPSRGQPLPGFVRDPLSRTHRAHRQAGGAKATHHAGQGMAGRDRVPL